MTFHEVRLPEQVEKGAKGGPAFRTSIVVLASGHERRNEEWSITRGNWDLAYGVQRKQDFDDVIIFFYARRGRAHGFRFKDWTDFEMARQSIGTTDGSTATYQTFKRYDSAGFNFDRTLSKLVTGTVSVWVNDVSIVEGAGAGEFTVDVNTGIITLGSTLAAQSGTDVEALCEFDVPVRFDTDELDVTAFTHDAARIDSLPIIEIRI